MKRGESIVAAQGGLRWIALLAMAILCAYATVGWSLARGSALPDGRAYELVTPPNTGAVAPSGLFGAEGGLTCFPTKMATSDGSGLAYVAGPGSMPGFPGNGGVDLFEAIRTSGGWESHSKSPSPAESEIPRGGGCQSEDHQFSTLLTGPAPADLGSLVWEGKETSYVRAPSGQFQMVGVGSEAIEPRANVRWVSNEGTHVIFTAQKQLEPEAPAAVGSAISWLGSSNPAVGAIYDRTPQGLQVVSLLPDGSAPDPSVETTFFNGVSKNGVAVAFELVDDTSESELYVHRAGEATKPVVSGSSGLYRFGGFSADGNGLAYVESENDVGKPEWGDIFWYDLPSTTATQITTGKEAAIVNVAEDGSRVYFVSMKVLTGTQSNPAGAVAQAGKPNLYVWSAADKSLQFIATVALGDVVPSTNTGTEPDEKVFGLTKWLSTAVAPQQNQRESRGNATSRTTPDGTVLVFEARTNITGFASNGHVEIYRYSLAENSLACVSCPAIGTPPKTNARLMRAGIPERIEMNVVIENVTADGSTVFFQSKEPLSSEDVNKSDDVYEWKNGSRSLISSGQGKSNSYLYATTPTGNDVFFTTSDQLVPQDESSVISIYDARIGGGFPGPPALPPSCEGDGCQGPIAPLPILSRPASSSFVGPQNPKIRRHRHKQRHHKKRKGRHHRRAARHYGTAGRATRPQLDAWEAVR